VLDKPKQYPRSQLRPTTLSLFDSITLVAGSMIGSGIFIVSADIARDVRTPALLLTVWIASGLMTVAGALACGELAAMMPQTGGQYVYLREAYGGMSAFLFGWTFFLVIQTGTIAAVSVAFVRFMAILVPGLGGNLWFGSHAAGISPERLAAIAVIVVLTAANVRGLHTGRVVQNLFTSAKVASLLLIALVCLVIAPNRNALAINFGSVSAFLGDKPLIGLGGFGAAMVGGLFSADAWASVTFTASELENPKRDLPLSLAVGTGLVVVLYIMTNNAYLAELPLLGNPAAADVFGRGISAANSDRVASAALEMVWGRWGAALTAALVMVSTFGCVNGLILAGARVLRAMALDGVFFTRAGHLNRAAVPACALVMQGGWAVLLALSGSYGDLLDYVIFAQVIFYAITVFAVFVLRAKWPSRDRPYHAWGYPYLPAAYIACAMALTTDLLIVRTKSSALGLLIVLSGVPVYLVRNRNRTRA
jgi:APA family basic amino acid/polyamine antiporter